MTNIRNIFSRMAATALLLVPAVGATMLTGCSDDVDDEAFYTFTGHTVSSYIHEDGRFSIFASLLDETGIGGLLSTYGHYTLFAPTDESIRRYLSDNGMRLGDLTLDEKRELVYNHIVNSKGIDYTSDQFEEGALPESSMSDNYITVSFAADATGSGLVIYLNKMCPSSRRTSRFTTVSSTWSAT